jgi:MFS family permease
MQDQAMATPLAGTSVQRRRMAGGTLSPRAAYVLMASVIGLALFASGTPSPLYGTYSAMWAMSPVLLTLVYATYAFGVLATLLLAGSVSDHVGRRPVLFVALAALMAAFVMFMLADSVLWLFAARAVQGLATGLAVSTASAALLDLHPRRDAGAVGLHNGAVSAAGMGLGVLVSAAIVELLPAPRVLPYVAAFILFSIALAGTLAMSEPVADPVGLRLRPQRPSVPPAVRPAFVLAGLGVLSSWSIGGLLLALGPQLLGTLFHTSDHLVGGLSVFALAGPAALSQLVFRRSAPWASAAGGSVALAVGLLGIVLAAATGSGAVYLLASVIGGAGFGTAFLGALRALSSAIPAERRGSVMSAFYVAAYCSLSVPAILAGVLVRPLGMTSTFEIFGSVVAGVALIVATLARRSRPEAARRTSAPAGAPAAICSPSEA